MTRHSRIPAAIILLATAAAGWAYLETAGARDSGDGGPTLEQLELMIARPDAEPETWRLYAERLVEVERYAHAATAYERYLEHDPYDRETRMRCALALAHAASAPGSDADKTSRGAGETSEAAGGASGGERLFAFMQDLVLMDPKLGVDVFNRPEMQLHLKAERFQALRTEAVIQSMD